MDELRRGLGKSGNQRLIAPAVLWALGIIVALVACLAVSLLVPVLQVRASVKRCAESHQPDVEVERLGGNQKAASKIGHYLKWPESIAPGKEQAVRFLGCCGDTAAWLLIECTRNEDPAIRRRSTRLLGEMRSVAALDAIIARLDDTDGQTGAYAIEALGKIGDARATGPLIGLLEADKNNEVAAEALGKIKDPKAVQVLEQSFVKGEPCASEFAAWALASIGTPDAIRVLAIDSEDGNRLSAAEKAIGTVRNPSAVPMLIELLKHRSLLMRARAAMALGEIRDARAVDSLIAMTSGGIDTNLDVLAAIKALGNIGDERALAPLVRLLSLTGEDQVTLHSKATTAILQIGTPRAIEALTPLAEKNEVVRRQLVKRGLLSVARQSGSGSE
jgi:HEAT repeat protein